MLYFVLAEFFYMSQRFISIFASLTLMQITLHLADFTGDQNVAFDFSDACLFGHPFYFDYQYLISLASDFSFQHFNAEKCCN